MKTISTSFITIIVLLMAGAALAHSPQAIGGFYDLGRQELNVTVQHLVTKPKEHFIDELIIYKNGKEVIKKRFDFQTSHRNQTMPPFRIPASVGDTFRVVADCNRGGQFEATVEVTDEAPDVRKLN